MNEIELKFFEIDVEKIIQKILDIGAKFIYEVDIEAIYFFKEDIHHDEVIRVRRKTHIETREEVVEIVHKSKKKLDSKFKEREETEFISSSFHESIKFLEKLGFQIKMKTYKKRIHYELEECSFEIDTIDPYPPFLEIETQSNDRMEEMCKRLGLNIDDSFTGTYKEYYCQ